MIQETIATGRCHRPARPGKVAANTAAKHNAAATPQ